jgi:hypothetical protein
MWGRVLDLVKLNAHHSQLDEAAHAAAKAACGPIPVEIMQSTEGGYSYAAKPNHFKEKRERSLNGLLNIWGEHHGAPIADAPANVRAEATELADMLWNKKITIATDHEQKWQDALARRNYAALEKQRDESCDAMFSALEAIDRTRPRSILGVQIKLLAIAYYSFLDRAERPEKLDGLIQDLAQITGRTFPNGTDGSLSNTSRAA